MEEEAREILKAGVTAKRAPKLNFAESIRRQIDAMGGADLTLPPREAVRRSVLSSVTHISTPSSDLPS
jgi:plasmid stability protein